MLSPELPVVDPALQPAADFARPAPLDLSFPGWTPDVFALLDRLRAHPHIDQYKQEKPGVTTLLKDPFKQYRDDLVVNWVLPNRLDLETEKNVFSRLLKNDFGAGGCHDNLWMAFYRPHTKRLKDVQVSHKISPDGFEVGLYVGSYAKDLLDRALARIAAAPATYLDLINPLLDQAGWHWGFHAGTGDAKRAPRFTAPLAELPEGLSSADGLWLRRRFPRDQVLDWGPQLVAHALDAVADVWPLYRFYLAGR
ncbi:hypothetical protein [Salisaeta longa]|uniref:hypothetical protein n=1 Tax=Salisaeta longa TaxID=503170 RepID=UPI0003B578C3|nr:hypothetical protein [Salisaeta longa]